MVGWGDGGFTVPGVVCFECRVITRRFRCKASYAAVSAVGQEAGPAEGTIAVSGPTEKVVVVGKVSRTGPFLAPLLK